MTRFDGLIAATGLLITLVACSGAGSAASITSPPEADTTITAQGSIFSPNEIAIAGGEPVRLFFRNFDGQPHNVAIYTDASASTKLFVGATVVDAATLYDVPALDPGRFFFRCDVHPQMTGVVVVEG